MMDVEVLKVMLTQYGRTTAIIAALIAFFVSTTVSMLVIWFQKKLQASLDPKIHVSKTQFDVEYQAYREIWDSLVEVRNAVLSLRPIFDFVEEGKTNQEIKAERLEVFGNKYNSFSNLVEKNKPFYAPDVYSEMSQIREIMHSEAIEFQYGEMNPLGEYWTKAMENRKQILALIDSTNEAIRRRITSISIVN